MADAVSLKSPGPVVGAYSMALESGALTGVGANAPVWSMRFNGTSPASLAVIERVSLLWVTTTAFTAAQLLDHALIVARSFTVSDSTGTAATLTGDTGSHRTDFPATGVVDMRIGTTAALTAGTRTLDATPIGVTAAWSSGAGVANTAGAPDGGVMLYSASPTKYPLVLNPNEGLVITNVTAMGAAGVIKLIVNVSWKEMLNY